MNKFIQGHHDLVLNVFIHVDLTLELWRRNYGNDWTPTHEALTQNYRIIYRGKFYKRGSEFLSGLSNCQEIPIWLINRVIVPKNMLAFVVCRLMFLVKGG